MPTAKDRLKRFLALADQGAAQRVALAEDLIDFLIHWPEECPRTMRRPVMTLLDMTLQEADDFTRARLSVRLDQVQDLPLELANRMFHCAPNNVRKAILKRNESARDLPRPETARDPIRLLTAARQESAEGFRIQFARAMHVAPGCAAAILADESGQSLATICKGTGVARGIYSALALLIFTGKPTDPARLAAYDDIAQSAAENMASYWQTQPAQQPSFAA